MAWILVSLRRLAGELTGALALSGLVFLSVLLLGVGPRLLDRVAGDALQSEVANTAPADRGIQVSQVRRLGTGSATGGNATLLATLADAEARGATLEDSFAPPIPSLVADRELVVETPSWQVLTSLRVTSLLTLRIQTGALDRVHLATGTLPGAGVSVMADPRPGLPPDTQLFVYDAIMSTAAATEMGVTAGMTLAMEPDRLDSLNTTLIHGAAVHVVGTYDISDPGDPFWLDDAAVWTWATVPVSPNEDYARTTVLLAPEVYPQLVSNMLGQGTPLRYTWRYYTDPARFQSTDVAGLATSLRQLESEFPASAAATGATVVHSGLLLVMERYLAEWRSADAVLLVAGVAAAAIGAVTLIIVVVMASNRRRRIAALARSRGASGRQIAASTGVEGVLLSLPPALAAAAVAIVVVPRGSNVPTLSIALGVTAITTAVLMAVVARLSAAPPGEGRRPALARGITPRRLVLEGVVVGLALGGAVLLRDRGVTGGGSTASLSGADPLIVTVPALIGLAAGIVAMRLYPLPTTVLARLAAMRRDLVPVLAIRRATRGSTGPAVLLTLLATATVGAFASATLLHLQRAADVVAWHDVGAAIQLSRAGALPASLDPAALSGVQAAATSSSRTVTLGNGELRQMVALESAAYEAVVAGTPIDPALPASMLGGPGGTSAGASPGAGSATAGPGGTSGGVAPSPGVAAALSEGLPAVASPSPPGATSPISVGDHLQLQIGQESIAVVVAELRPTFPAVPVGQAFVVVSRDQLAATHPYDVLPPTAAFLRADPAVAPTLRASLGVADVTVLSEVEVAAAIRDAPAVTAVSVGVASAALVALVSAALAVALALALAGASHRLELAYLRSIGVSSRQGVALVLFEYVPTVVIAFVAGVLVGWACFLFLLPGLGLDALVGSPLEVPLQVEPAHLALLLAALAGIVGLGWAVGSLGQSGADPATALRLGVDA